MKDFVEELREKILDLLKKNKDGLTINKISEELGVTSYMLKSELGVLENYNKIQIINVGASKLVKLK